MYTAFEKIRVSVAVANLTWIYIYSLLLRVAAGQVAEFMVWSASLLASDKQLCFTGTRVSIRKEIMDWIDSVYEDVPRVLLLSGMAGTGKSTIAYTIAVECAQQHKLGASFAFNRRAQPPPTARMLFPHIAASLAAFYPAVKDGLADTQKKEIASGLRLQRQLQELLIEPLQQSAPTLHPTVIVIDALDEADDDGVHAKELTLLLADRCAELPSNIRILVSSRPAIYITDIRSRTSIQYLAMPNRSDSETLTDVARFIRDQLKDLRDLDEADCDKLAETSQGLFQWAAIACKEIIGTPLRRGSTPRKRYEMVVESGIGKDKTGLLDSLYKDVLNRAFDSRDHQVLKQVIAALFVLMEPMTLDPFRQLYGEEADVDSTLPYLASILDGISDTTRHVQPNHTSLRDFFLDPSRSGPLCVRDLLSEAHAGRIARRSFSIVSTSLPQDASNLDFARIYDDEFLKSEADRVYRDMPPHVAYAILYCVKHLAEAPTPEEAFWTGLRISFLADDHALPWIEVFCLLVIQRLAHAYENTTPELSGCVGLLAHVAVRTVPLV